MNKRKFFFAAIILVLLFISLFVRNIDKFFDCKPIYTYYASYEKGVFVDGFEVEYEYINDCGIKPIIDYEVIDYIEEDFYFISDSYGDPPIYTGFYHMGRMNRDIEKISDDPYKIYEYENDLIDEKNELILFDTIIWIIVLFIVFFAILLSFGSLILIKIYPKFKQHLIFLIFLTILSQALLMFFLRYVFGFSTYSTLSSLLGIVFLCLLFFIFVELALIIFISIFKILNRKFNIISFVTLSLVGVLSWYYIIMLPINGFLGSTCDCPRLPKGLVFPRIIPRGCGDCGVGISLYEFLVQLFILLIPVIILTIYSFYKIIKEKSNKKVLENKL